MNKLKNKYYKYNPSEFMPIYQDGAVKNKREFHIYKIKRASKLISQLYHLC